MTIDEYVTLVSAHLNTRSARARAALDDLRDALAELSVDVGETRACAEFGDPEAYARTLDEELAREEAESDADGYVAGIPYRLRVKKRWWGGFFDPTDPRIVVPKAMGVGWTVNLGALAVKLGGLRPDDMGEDTVTELRPGAAVASLASLAGLAGVALAVALLAPRGIPYPLHWTGLGAPDRWGDWRGALLGPALWALGGVVVAAVPTLLRRPVLERLFAQAFLGMLIAPVATIPVMAYLGRHGAPVGPLVLAGIALGLAFAFLTLVFPFRAAVRRAAAKDQEWTR